MIHHLRNPPNVVIRRTQELNQTLKRLLPEHSGTAQMPCQLGEPVIGIRENLPDSGERDTGVEKIEQCRSGGNDIVLGGGTSAVKAVGNVAVLEVPEGYEVRPNDAGVLRGCGFFPAEGLAGREGEW